VVFGELVQVGVAGEFGEGAFVGDDGKLDEVVLGDKAVVNLEGERVDDVFGVMEDEDFVALASLLLVELDGFDDPVEAVCLAGGAGVGADDAMDVGAVEGGAGDLHLGGFIVGIAADEDVVVGVVEPVGGGLEHGADDGGFIPGRDEDGDRFFACIVELPLFAARIFAALGEQMAEGLQVEDEVEKEVVQATEEVDAGEQPLEVDPTEVQARGRGDHGRSPRRTSGRDFERVR
jgi:hypothetical protein